MASPATALDHMATSPSPEISKLESQIQALTDLSTRLQQLRDVPAWLYKSPNSMMPMEPIREQFENLRQLGNNLTSEIVQEALKAARGSEEKDKSELTLKYRTDTNKAKYVISSSHDQTIQPWLQVTNTVPRFTKILRVIPNKSVRAVPNFGGRFDTVDAGRSPRLHPQLQQELCPFEVKHLGTHAGRDGQVARSGDCPVGTPRYPCGLLRPVYSYE